MMAKTVYVINRIDRVNKTSEPIISFSDRELTIMVLDLLNKEMEKVQETNKSNGKQGDYFSYYPEKLKVIFTDGEDDFE